MSDGIFQNRRLENGEDKWFASVSLDDPANSVECVGLAHVVGNGRIKQIYAPSVGAEHAVVKIEGESIRIYSFPGGVRRCYARIKNNTLLVSNIASALFEKNEKITISGEVLMRQVYNMPTPLDDLFLDATLLESSAAYKIEGGKFVFEESNIKPVKSSLDSVHEHLLQKFDEICKPGQPLAVLLSAGIDSRLNLAICLYFARKYGNEVVAYHEYKDKKEHDIAKHITDIAQIPFVSVSRDRFKNEPLEVMLSPKFIEFHGGLYRESLLRWIIYMEWMRKVNPDSTIIGMGSEAHKGKFYRDIKNISRAQHVLGTGMRINSTNEKYFAPFLSYRAMDDFFTDFQKHSRVFGKLSSRIDFIHHYAYTAKHSMARSPYFSLYLGLPFPFLEDDFLSKAFSLPKEEKADARISKTLISKLAPRFSRVPFISGNQKGFENHIYHLVKEEIKYRFLVKKDSSRRGESIVWDSQIVRERLDGASSEITDILQKFIKGIFSGEKQESIQFKCALRVYLYLRQIEKESGIEFIHK